MASLSLTNGHSSPLAVPVTVAEDVPTHSDSDLSDAQDPIAQDPSSDEDAAGELDDEDEEMADASDSSEDEDAEGEPDGDYDSESPPPARAESSRARSSTSQESRRPTKRKASVEDDSYMSQNPELYGLRRSVRGINSVKERWLTLPRDVLDPTVVSYGTRLQCSIDLLIQPRSIAAMRMMTRRHLINLVSDNGQPREKV